MIALCRHVVAPFDAGAVVIVEGSRGLSIVNGVTKVRQAGDHVSRVYGETQAHVGGSNLSFA
jgi:hypothetical protein